MSVGRWFVMVSVLVCMSRVPASNRGDTFVWTAKYRWGVRWPYALHKSVRSTLSPSAEINSGLRAVWGIWTGPGRWVIRVRRRVLKVLQCDNQSAVTTLLSQLWGLFLCHSDKNRPWWVPYIKQHFPSFLKHINNTAVFFSRSPSTPFLLSLHWCFSSLWHSHTSSLSHLSASIPLSVLPLLTVRHPLPILLTLEFVAALRYWSV